MRLKVIYFDSCLVVSSVDTLKYRNHKRHNSRNKKVKPRSFVSFKEWIYNNQIKIHKQERVKECNHYCGA